LRLGSSQNDTNDEGMSPPLPAVSRCSEDGAGLPGICPWPPAVSRCSAPSSAFFIHSEPAKPGGAATAGRGPDAPLSLKKFVSVVCERAAGDGEGVMLPAFPACAAASGGLGALHTQQHMSFAAARSFTRRGCTHRGTSRATPGASSPARHPRSQVPSASGLSPALVHFPPRFYLSPLPPLPQLPLLSPSISHGPHRRGSRAAGELSGSLRLLGVPEAGLTQPGEPGAESPIGIARDTLLSRTRTRGLPAICSGCVHEVRGRAAAGNVYWPSLGPTRGLRRRDPLIYGCPPFYEEKDEEEEGGGGSGGGGGKEKGVRWRASQ
jgi:hypothetical protein